MQCQFVDSWNRSDESKAAMFVTLNPFIGSIARSHLDELIALLTFILCLIFKELKFIMLARDKTVFMRVNRSETPMPMTSGPNKVQVHSILVVTE